MKEKGNIEKKADEIKEYLLPMETSFDMSIPSEVIETLKLERGDSIAFVLEDNGEVYLRKA